MRRSALARSRGSNTAVGSQKAKTTALKGQCYTAQPIVAGSTRWGFAPKLDSGQSHTQPSRNTRLASVGDMQISDLARQTSVSVHALRHYERLGLIHPERRANGYRDYPASIRREVVFIAMSRQLGFALPDIARRLEDYRAGILGIDDMVKALQERADALDQQISQLQAQKNTVLEHQAWLRGQLRRQQQPEQRDAGDHPAPPRRGRNAATHNPPPWPRVRSAPSQVAAGARAASSPTPATSRRHTV